MFFAVDLAVAIAIPLLVFGLHRLRVLPVRVWKLYWLGVVIGLVWEIAFTAARAQLYLQKEDFPGPASLQVIAHSLWDGGLFVVGLGFVWRLCPEPRLTRFSGRELGILVAWGQLQSLGVELAAASADAWVYRPSWWNPELFSIAQAPITLLPQLVWLIGTVVFHLGALALERPSPGSSTE